jgi:hypothetical protein
MAVLQTSSGRKTASLYRQSFNRPGNQQALPLLTAIADELLQIDDMKLRSLLTARQLLQEAFQAIDCTRDSATPDAA